jgi:hypothetical protein
LRINDDFPASVVSQKTPLIICAYVKVRLIEMQYVIIIIIIIIIIIKLTDPSVEDPEVAAMNRIGIASENRIRSLLERYSDYAFLF